jgi:hypothetical protein
MIEELWGLLFGNGGNGGATNELFFSAGIPGSDNIEDHGLFGDITAVQTAVPEPSTWAMMLLGLAGLGFAFRQSRRRVEQGRANDGQAMALQGCPLPRTLGWL